MYQERFPDSTITKNFKCSRTKTTLKMHYELGYETFTLKLVNRVYERGTIFFS